MIGQTISHYRILEKLGEGGMGVVYKAEDTKLRRTVALKFLPSHLSASEQDKARFIQEAQSASALNHPNVCTIHDIQEHDGQMFIVMECVEGKTLRHIIQSAIPNLQSAIAYAIQIGDALHEAHGKGVVHRDVKAENIMVNTKNQIKVMDFGLAKLKGSLKLTRTSSTVGTLAYMSPEQIQGGEVDARSDIFSFGVVLFEMLTGHMPFRGEHEAAMMYSILNEDAEQLTKYLPDASPELLHILGRALEKDPEDRYQSVHDMVIDLRRLKKESTRVSRTALSTLPVPDRPGQPVPEPPAAPPPAQPSNRKWMVIGGASLLVGALAVVGYLMLSTDADSGERLPIAVADFVNQTKEEELDGLSGMLITSMEQSKRLAVVTRSRMFDILKMMGREETERIDEQLGKEICRQANIGALVTASIRKFGKLYTIDLKVVDPLKNEYIFTAKEEAEGQESIPSMLDKLSEKTRIGLKEKVSEVTAAQKQIASVTTTNLEAYKHYFEGEQLINRLKMDDAEKALRKAVDLDSTFGLAWYRLAYVLNWSRGDGGSRANQALDKATLLMDRMPDREQYLIRALKAEQGEGFARGVQILREMEKLYPDDKEMMYNIGDWSYHARDLTTAATYLEKVLQADPSFERALQHLVWTYRDQGRYEKGLDAAKRYVSASGSGGSYQLLGQMYEFLGQYETGLNAMVSARELHPTNHEITGSIARLYRFLGQGDKAEAELKSLVQDSKDLSGKRVGYGALVNYYSYHGRFRDALRAIDARIEESWKAHDTALAAGDYAVKAILFVEAWNDVGRGWKEMEKSFPFQGKIRSQNYWGVRSLLYVYHGDHAAADTLFRDFTWWHQALRSLRHSLQNDCAKAELLLDSTVRSSPSPGLVELNILLPLVECQLRAGMYDKALASTTRMRNLRDAALTIQHVKTFLLAGRAHEGKGERKLAVENYERFLDIWKDADKDLPDYIDAKARLGKLKAVASK